MRLLRLASVGIIILVILSPVSAVEVSLFPTVDKNPPPEYTAGYNAIEHDIYPSRTIILIDARVSPEEKSLDDSAKLIGGVITAVGILMIIVGAVAELPTASASTILIAIGVGMVASGITTISIAFIGGGQSVSIEVYSASSGELTPVPNFIGTINGGTRGWLGGWGFTDSRGGNTKYVITHEDGKTPKETATGVTVFPSDLHLSISMDDAEHDKRFTLQNPNGREVRQFILNEASATNSHDFAQLNTILSISSATSLSFLTEIRRFNDSTLESRWNMHIHQSSSPYTVDIPSSLLDAGTIVEYRIVFITYFKENEYATEFDEAGYVKSLSDIPYLPRISDTVECYFINTPLGMQTPDEKSNTLPIPASHQDNAFGYVDYMLDRNGNHVHPEPIISASNSMAYALIWGRYEGTHDDGWMTTDFTRYSVTITDKTSSYVYSGKVIGVCLSKNERDMKYSYLASRQAYVIVMFNYTYRGGGISYPYNIDATLKEAGSSTYHTFWEDDVSIHPVKLLPDLEGHAGMLADAQPFNPFFVDFPDYEKWSPASSQFKKYITLRTNKEFIPVSFCSAFIEQRESTVTIIFSLCGNGGLGLGFSGSALTWTVSNIRLTLTLPHNTTPFATHSFGSITLTGQKLFTYYFTTSNLTLPTVLNLTLSADFTFLGRLGHKITTNATGIIPIQDNYDDYEYLLVQSLVTMQSALKKYPITPSDRTEMHQLIDKYCNDYYNALENRLKSITAKAEQKKDARALDEISKAQRYLDGLSAEEQNTMYKGTCQMKWKNNFEKQDDMTDPHVVGAYIHIAYNLIYAHWLVNEQLNKAMFYVNSKNATQFLYNNYGVTIKDAWTKEAESSVGGGDNYVKRIDWSLIVIVASVIIAIISSIIIYRFAREKNIIPDDWITGWKLAVLLLIFAGITAGLFAVYLNTGLAIAHNLGGYTSLRGWWG